MAAKKDDVTTYTKPELIKALRASVAREAKLQKRIAELQQKHVVEPAMRRYKDAAGLDEAAPPAFPWEQK